MHHAEHLPSMLTLVRFGFDRERLYVRVDARRPLVDLLAEDYEFSLKFLLPERVRFSVRQRFGRMTGLFWDRQADAPQWTERGPGNAVVAVGSVLEVGVPLADLGVTAGDAVAFVVAVYDGANNEIERHPAHRPIEAEVPDRGFEARHWTA